jgi:ribosomal protein S18 acetylase RimI-like enzyme
MATTRYARAEDENDVIRLLTQLFSDRDVPWEKCRATFRELLHTPRGVVLVAEDVSGVVGVISLSFTLAIRYGGDYAQIEELVVDTRCRGQGYGALLVKAAMAEASGQAQRLV